MAQIKTCEEYVLHELETQNQKVEELTEQIKNANYLLKIAKEQLNELLEIIDNVAKDIRIETKDCYTYLYVKDMYVDLFHNDNKELDYFKRLVELAKRPSREE